MGEEFCYCLHVLPIDEQRIRVHQRVISPRSDMCCIPLRISSLVGANFVERTTAGLL